MKKLKQMSGPYSIGFELSSTAHGFVATDPNGNVLYHGKQPVMGTRVFKEGQHAAEARMPRTSRRGIQRRRGREHEMERVFAPVISSIDPDFFIRRRMSYKLGKIRFESDPIGFSYSRLFHSFPTLAHLDVALMEADSAMDPRLIFEAVANHVVRRGHFLLENQNVSSTNSDIDTQVANYAEVLVFYFEDTLDERIELSLEALDINGNVTARELQKQFASAMCVSGDDIQKKTEKAQIKAIADLVAGYKADLTVLVPDAEKLPKVSISDGDALEEFLADSCPDSLVPVLMAAQALYTSWKLQGMLSYAPGKSLSHNQVAQHDVYGKQLRMLKDLALKYVAKQDANGNVDEDGFKDYVRFFGGPKREDGYRYDKVQVKKQDSPKNNMGYTAYNLNVLGYEEFAKRVELLFKDTDAVNDPQYKTMMEAFANERIYLYFHQAGKCLYTGKPIDITRIASNDYYVDHVVPLAYRKDESLDNKVLVYAEASRYKSETLLVSPAVQRKMLPFWRMLRNAGLMSERKLNALIRTEISEGMLKSIIGRQFTENSWEAKLFTAAIAAKYPGTVVIPVKAGVTTPR